MSEKFGIENLTKVIEFAVEIGETIDTLGHTAGIAKWGQLISALPAVIDFSKTDFKALKAEIADLSTDERIVLENVIKTKLSLQDKKLENAIENGIDLVESLIVVGVKAVDYFKGLKASPVVA